MINNMLNECKTVPANRAIINKKWILIDAAGQCLGRLISVVANILMGKNKIYYT